MTLRNAYILLMLSFLMVCCLCGCSGTSENGQILNRAELVMESRPDSALIILDSIPVNNLRGEERARYALLKSMALDKNYIDTTTFDVLQPAIDWYLDNGSPDEKLKTYYYQGRIFQNRNETENALNSYEKSLSQYRECTDSLSIARAFVARAIVFYEMYSIKDYINDNLKAADIYSKLNIPERAASCYQKAMNGAVIEMDEKTAKK